MRWHECLFIALLSIVTLASSAEAWQCGYSPPDRKLKDGSIIVTGIVQKVVERERREIWPGDVAEIATQERMEAFSDDFWPIVTGENAARLEVQDSWKGPVSEGAVWLTYGVSTFAPSASFKVGDLVTVIAHGSMRSGYRVHACSSHKGAPTEEFREVLERYRSQTAELYRRLEDDPGSLSVLWELYHTFYAYRDFERAHETANRMTVLQLGNLLYQSMSAKALLESDPEDKRAAEFALSSFEQILAKSPLHAEASHGRTLALLRLEREDEIDPDARDFSLLNVPHSSELGVDLSGRELAGASFRNARVSRLNLMGSNLTNADFGGARIRQSGFHGANLAGANFAASCDTAEGGATEDLQTDLYYVAFRNADLRGADFAGARLRLVLFEGADLSAADFSRAQIFHSVLTGAHYDCATRWPEGFDPVAAGAVLTEPGC